MIRELRQAYAAAEADDDGVDAPRHRRRAGRSAPAPTSPRSPTTAGSIYDEPYLSTYAQWEAPQEGDAAVPHDDQADPDRGQRAVLRRRARPGHDRRHRDRVGPGRVLRSAREHRAGLGPRDGAPRAGAADEHRHADGAHGQARADERASAPTSSAWSPRWSSTTGCWNARARSPPSSTATRRWPCAAPGSRSARASTSRCTRPRSWPRPSASGSCAPTTPRKARSPSSRSATRSGRCR